MGSWFRRTATEIWNRLRGFQPWPGAYTTFRGKSLNITAARPAECAHGNPGTLHILNNRLEATCGGGTALELLEMQPEGKKKMLARDFLNGYRPQNGEKLGERLGQ